MKVSPKQEISQPGKGQVLPKYVATVSLRFVIVASFAAALMAFGLGRIARATLLGSIRSRQDNAFKRTERPWRDDDALDGYKIWDASQGITTFIAPARVDEEQPQCEQTMRGEPAARCGQLLTTIRFASHELLLAEKSIQDAFVEIARRSGLSLMFHHCIQRTQGGLVCTVGLNEGKFMVATWPENGEATFDVSVCGDDDNRDWMITHILPIVEDVFKQQSSDKIFVEWMFKHRGFQEDLDDTFNDLTKVLEVGRNIGKAHLASVQTNFQRVDIYNFQRLPGHEEFAAYREDPSFAHALPENRMVWLDHVLQSTLRGDAAYHEALVHPALMAHSNPRRVAIVGGGEGATLREVLRHDTVERAVMVEIDEGMVNASRTYLPEWSDCSNIVGSAPSCFEDSRAETYYEDAVAWFISRYGEGAEPTNDKEDGFDVIIMDALDPNSGADFSYVLYDNKELMSAFSNALGDDGIFVVQVGESETAFDVPYEYGADNRLLLTFRQHLADSGFSDILEYFEPHCGFGFPWSYEVAMKSPDSVSRFFNNEAAVNMAIAKRIRATVDGRPSLRYFDGATMATYQQPSRAAEDIWCLTNGANCNGKHGFDPSIVDISVEDADVLLAEESAKGPALVSSKTIPGGSYLNLQESTQSLLVPPLTYEKVTHAVDSRVSRTLEWYGMESNALGKTSMVLSTGPMMYAAHDDVSMFSQSDGDESYKVFNPFARRHLSQPLGMRSLATIKQGESIIIGGTVASNDQLLWMDPTLL